MKKYWMVARTTKGKEVEVSTALNASGQCEAYCPMRTDLRRPRNMKLPKGKFVEVKVPLFPRYLFWRGDWHTAQKTKYFSGVLSMGENIAKISDDDLTKVREFERFGFPDAAAVFSNIFSSGDKVEIIDGVLEGKHGIFVGSAGTSSVFIDVQRGHYNGQIRVQVPLGMIDHR